MASDRKFWNKIARKYATSKISDMASYEYTLARTQSHLLQTDHVWNWAAARDPRLWSWRLVLGPIWEPIFRTK